LSVVCHLTADLCLIAVLKKRLAQNFGANLFAQFTNVLVQLASVPLFLTFWSKKSLTADLCSLLSFENDSSSSSLG